MPASSCGRAAASRCTSRGDEGGRGTARPARYNEPRYASRSLQTLCWTSLLRAKEFPSADARLPRREIMAWSLVVGPRARHVAAAQQPTPLLRETLSYERFSGAGRGAG